MEHEVAERVVAHRWYARYPRILPVAAFLLAAMLTAISVFAIERVEAERAAAQLNRVVTAAVTGIERRASAHSAYLLAGASLIGEQNDISASHFRRFSAQLSRDPGFRGAEAIGWAKLVPTENVARFTAAMRSDGLEGFTVHPANASSAAVQVPVTFIEPDTPRNHGVLGFDMYSDTVRRTAMDAAARNGVPTASGKLVLIQDRGRGDRPGFIIYMPVFGQSSESSRLLGFIYSPFSATTFLESALDPEQRENYSIRLYDGETQPDRLLAGSGIGNGGGPLQTASVMVAGRRMMLGVEAPPPATLSNLSLLTLLFGLIAAALILVVIRLVTSQANEDSVALAWYEEQASIRKSLTRELNHRVKNTLANVLSIVALTRRRATNLDDFAQSVTGRIGALSATHDLLTQSEWGTTPIRAVVDAELAPYIGAAEGTVVTRGPDVEIAPNDALSLGLALHELATNAAKFGALSVPGGTIEVRWDLATPELARIVWVERGGPVVTGERRRGFGTELIEKIVAHELGTAVDLRFEATGVECTLLVPVRLPVAFRIRAEQV